MFQRINDLVSGYGYYLQSWNTRCSNKVWLGIATVEHHLDRARDATDHRYYSLEFNEYLDKDWIPFVIEDTFIEALTSMEKKLSKIPLTMLNEKSSWSTYLYQAYDQLEDVLTENNIQLLDEIKLPETLDELLAKEK